MKRPASEIAEELCDQIDPQEAAEVLGRLDLFMAPELPTQATEALISRLRPLVPRPRPRRFRAYGLDREPVLSLLHYLTTQARLFPWYWWLLSLGAVLAGLLAESFLAEYSLSLSAAAPLLVIGGVLTGFRFLKGGALLIELSCPVTPVQIILSRLIVMLGYYLVLGAGLAMFSGSGALKLLLAWCAALFLFTGLMLLLTTLAGTAPAAIAALCLWGAQVLMRDKGLSLFMPSDAAAWLPLQLTAALLGAVLLLLALTGPSLARLTGRGGR